MIILDLSYQIVWLVRHVCSNKAELSFSQKKTDFWCSFKHVPNWHLVCVIYSLSHSLQGIQWIASVHCSFVIGSLGLAKICPKVKDFWTTLTLRLSLLEHTCLTIYHTTGWDKSKIITTNLPYNQCLCLEAWHINSAHAPLNHDDGGLLLIVHLFAIWTLIY